MTREQMIDAAVLASWPAPSWCRPWGRIMAVALMRRERAMFEDTSDRMVAIMLRRFGLDLEIQHRFRDIAESGEPRTESGLMPTDGPYRLIPRFPPRYV